jgi:hypothetical protein
MYMHGNVGHYELLYTQLLVLAPAVLTYYAYSTYTRQALQWLSLATTALISPSITALISPSMELMLRYFPHFTYVIHL